MVTVHAAGGVEMMREAKKVLGDNAKLVAVTQLTSTSEEDMRDCQNIQTTVQESVVNYARKAKEAGLDGVVCSALEVELIKEATADDFLCVTPGSRVVAPTMRSSPRASMGLSILPASMAPSEPPPAPTTV